MATEATATEPKICELGGGGLLFPLTEAEQTWSTGARAVMYVAALFYLFLGVNIVSDKFVSAIEVITSKKKRVRQKNTGRIVTVAVWNGTVANLTLMALGSSAPEILLSVVETVSSGFHGGELGPSTIVGSAAFNLFMIVAVCIISIPSPESRQIKEHGVFVVTAAFSIFAYFWLVIICSVSSPDVIDIWEGLVTLALLPVLILISYLADIGYFSGGRQPHAVQYQRPLTIEDDFVPGQGELFGRSTSSLSSGDPCGSQGRNAAGMLVFPAETWDLAGGLEEREVLIPVLRRHGVDGTVSCKFRLEGRSAVPGYDFAAAAGELVFGPGDDRAFVPVKLLPKRLGEHSDQFQVVLDGPEGGAEFDPRTDGGAESCVLTVTIHNENDDLTRFSAAVRASRWVDGVLNVDSLRLGVTSWFDEIVDSLCQVCEEEDEKPSGLDWAMHVASVPWKLPFAIVVPPPNMGEGWPCFVMSLAIIGGLTTWVIDFAELFGCVTGIEDSITAITFVALGTSMPDLFASKAAACQDEYADASIVNVTGSNSVNVFLGIGIPWTMSAIYWSVQGATAEWKRTYFSYVETYPSGAFIVRSGDLAFSVVVFTVAASVALMLIHIRRVKFGGELGGPYMVKALSALLLTLLWLFYIGLSIWKVANQTASLGLQAGAIFIAVCVLENVMLVCGVALYLLRGRDSPDNLKDMEAGIVIEETAPKMCQEGAPSLPPLHTFPHLAAAQSVKAAHDPTGLRMAAGAFPTHSAASLATVYGSQFHDSIPDPVGVMSLTTAAMVCVAVKRFRSLDRRFRSVRDPAALGPAVMSTQPSLARESSFHSMDQSLVSSPCSTPRDTHPVSSVAGRVADIVGRNAVDWAALSAAGLAAAQLVDPEGTAAFLGSGA